MLKSPTIVFISFLFSILFSIYLALIASMVIFHDSIGYEYAGKLIFERGFKQFMIAGPQREPLYPILVAFSMKLGAMWHLSYQDVLKFLQISILLLTQILTWRICKQLKFSHLTTAAVILYIGFSPKIINSALICYSEIATYPWLLAIVLSASHCWMSLIKEQRNRLLIWSIILGLSFAGATLTKGVFLLIYPLFVLPIIFFTFISFKEKNKNLVILSLLFLVSVSVSYNTPIYAYKLANKKLNGQFTISDSRSSWALFGSTAKRVEPKTNHHLMAAVVYSVGSELCNKYYSLEECFYWTSSRSDSLGMNKTIELQNQKLSEENVNRQLIQLSVKEVSKDPIQYFLLTGIELIKVLFWDFRDIAYVAAFPTDIENIYNYQPLKYTLYFVMAFLTLVSFIYLTNFLRKNFSLITQRSCDMKFIILWQSCLLILFYDLAYSPFFIDPRHILPLGPVYLLVIAWMIENLFAQKTSNL